MGKIVKIANIKIGDNYPPVFFAEIGTFFNQDVDRAKKLITKIAGIKRNSEINVFFKTEILHDPNICLKDQLKETYLTKQGKVQKESFRNLIERKVLSLKKYQQIFDYCKKLKIPTVASVYDIEGADFALKNVDALKVASPNIIHIPLLSHISKLQIPVIIDTGRASLKEVRIAFNILKDGGLRNIIIEHSPDGHPASPLNHNLRSIETLKYKFKCPIGLSDHHVDDEMLYLSIGLGVNILEKGIIDNINEVDQDTAHAMLIDDLPNVLKKIYNCWVALGENYRKDGDKIYSNISTSSRMGMFSKKNLEIGDKLCDSDIYFAFPCKGLFVKDWKMILNKKLKKPIKIDQPFLLSHFK